MTVMDINEIRRVLPHRYPMLLVDRVVEMDGDRRAVGVKNVTQNEPFFQGHYPGQPIMPGVLIVEAMAQSWGVLIIGSGGADAAQNLNVRFLGIDNCRFRKPVVPGDQIRFELEALSQKRTIWKFSGKAFVDGGLVAEAELMATM